MQILPDLISIYRKLPVKPLNRPLNELYEIYKLHNKNKTVMAEVDGIKYQLDLKELIDSSIYYEGCFEPLTTAVIKKYVREGMTVLDIGANIGCHTLLFAKLVGVGGKVIAFEPMSYAYSKLKCNIELNNFDNIKLEKIALSNVIQTLQDVHFQTSWTLDGTSQYPNDKEIVDFITLDKYVVINDVDKIDFIKLDVDGYEYKVISGGIDTLKRDKPLLLMELGVYTLQNAGDNINDLINTLADIGYEFYSENNLNRFQNSDAMVNSIPKDGTINVLCK
jgi:FkbM family methyltransferase